MLGCVQFMLVLDDTVVNVALAGIRHDLGFDLAGLAWVVNAYLFAFGGLLLVAGRAGDVFGRRRVFLTGVAVFALASLVCGLAQTPWQLVTGRFVQGAGAALASPTALAMVTRLFPERGERSRALGVWGSLAVLGGTTGVVLSGVLTGMASWRWVFLVNVPLAAAALLLLPGLVRDERGVGRPRLHVPAAVLGTGAAVCLVQGVLLAGATNAPLQAIACFTVATGLALLFLHVDARGADRLVPVSLLSSTTRLLGNLACLLLAGTFFALSVLLMLHLQTVLGYTPLQAGLAYLPYAAGILLGVAASPAAQRRVGLRWTLVTAFAVAAVGMGLLARLPVDGTYVDDIVPGLLVAAVGSGLGYPAVTAAALTGTTDRDAGAASAVLTSMQQLGSVVVLAALVGVAGHHAITLAEAAATPAVASTNGLARALTVAAAVLAAVAVLCAMARGLATGPPPDRCRAARRPSE